MDDDYASEDHLHGIYYHPLHVCHACMLQAFLRWHAMYVILACMLQAFLSLRFMQLNPTAYNHVLASSLAGAVGQVHLLRLALCTPGMV